MENRLDRALSVSGQRPATQRWPSSPIRVTLFRAKLPELKKSSGLKWVKETLRPHLESKKDQILIYIYYIYRLYLFLICLFITNIKGFTLKRKKMERIQFLKRSARRIKAIIRVKPPLEDKKSKRNSLSPFLVISKII